jgi:hypothetical protein
MPINLPACSEPAPQWRCPTVVEASPPSGKKKDVKQRFLQPGTLGCKGFSNMDAFLKIYKMIVTELFL